MGKRRVRCAAFIKPSVLFITAVAGYLGNMMCNPANRFPVCTSYFPAALLVAAKKGDRAKALPPCFFNKAFDVALERFGEWVCVCRSRSASFRRVTARRHSQQQTKRNSRTSQPPLGISRRKSLCLMNKGCINKKYRLYYRQISTSCQLERNGY